MTFTVTITLPLDQVTIPCGDGSGLSNTIELAKVHADVWPELLRQGLIKPLTDINRDKDDGDSWRNAHARRAKRIENWYNGDYTVRGGGVGDPILVQMREELIAVYVRHGLTRKAAEKHVKGTAVQFLTAEAKKQKGDEKAQAAWLAEKIEHYRKVATDTLAKKKKAVESIDVSAIAL